VSAGRRPCSGQDAVSAEHTMMPGRGRGSATASGGYVSTSGQRRHRCLLDPTGEYNGVPENMSRPAVQVAVPVCSDSEQKEKRDANA